jgi:hypothetical protein
MWSWFGIRYFSGRGDCDCASDKGVYFVLLLSEISEIVFLVIPPLVEFRSSGVRDEARYEE